MFTTSTWPTVASVFIAYAYQKMYHISHEQTPFMLLKDRDLDWLV